MKETMGHIAKEEVPTITLKHCSTIDHVYSS